MAGSTVDDRLYALYIGLPSSVGTSVRMGNLDSEGNTFSADVAFCHVSAPPLCGTVFVILSRGQQ